MTSMSPHHRFLDAHPRLTQRERLPVLVFEDAGAVGVAVASEIDTTIRDAAARNRMCVLGLATGSTPIGVYEELVRRHREEQLSFENVVTFNLDEYWPMEPTNRQSYARFMHEVLFEHVNIDPANVHIPDGLLEAKAVLEACAAYEAAIVAAGGIDFQILGIGRTGHIGFNEPGSPPNSRTRPITLDKVTRMDAASDFFGEWNVPRKAITMGVGTILDARRVALMAFGEHKAPIVRRAAEEAVTNAVAASFLQEHADARMMLDPAAAAALTRNATPWLLGPLDQMGLEWSDALCHRAVTWLALTLGKAILKLTDEDYNENGLQDLLTARGSAHDINITAFKRLQHTITGWPGGKPDRPSFVVGKGVQSDNPPDTFPKRVLVFSPHPDDDVISMGGTLLRLCDQGHEVHVAYQTSGNIAVFDDEAIRHVDFISRMASAFDAFGGSALQRFEEEIRSFVHDKAPGQEDSPELRRIKGLIRRTEAAAAAQYSGVQQANIHFLDMPFYETGLVRKDPLGPEDIDIVTALLREIKPHLVYAAGDLSDPHGTHRVCLQSIFRAVEACRAQPWFQACSIWLYRGAWQEWPPNEIEMAVPLSPREVEHKRLAIFKHESQKDHALFPGPWDTREFWERAEERNRRTAQMYDQLGLPEYEAIEGFVRWKG